MLGTYQSKFRLDNGRLVFVPTDLGRETGTAIHKALRRRWRKPACFYHLRSGGQIVALKHHLADRVFAMIDISGFFDSITRANILRALRSIGYRYNEAWDITRQSTVEKTRKLRDFSLPYGFIQSPMLASLVLDRSALGRKMNEVGKRQKRLDEIVVAHVSAATCLASESNRRRVPVVSALRRDPAHRLLEGDAGPSATACGPAAARPGPQTASIWHCCLLAGWLTHFSR